MKQQNYLWTVDLPRGTRGWLSTCAVVLAVVLTLHWSAAGAQLSVGELAAGLPQIGDFLARTVPPDLNNNADAFLTTLDDSWHRVAARNA